MVYLLLLVAFVLAFHVALHRGLRPPRLKAEHIPASVGLAFEEVGVPTVRGKRLAGWFIPAASPGPAPAVLLMHGWGGNRETLLPLVLPLHGAGWAVLALDARCHGESDDDTFSSLPRFAEDMASGLDWLKGRQDVDGQRLALIGHSVGAAAALLTASRREDVAAVVSIAAFSHPVRVMGIMLAEWHIPMFPLGWYILRYVQWVIGHRFDEIAPINTIGRVAAPVLLVHGLDDRTVPIADARALAQRRAGLPGCVLEVPGRHDSFDEVEARLGEVVAFLEKAFAGAQGGDCPKGRSFS